MAITISGSGITSANIADGTIVNGDIHPDAAISGSKLTDIETVTKSTTAPSSPAAGDMWYDTSTNSMFVYALDGWAVAAARVPTGATSSDALTKSTQASGATGWYWLDINGTPYKVWIDQDYSGGGWVLWCNSYAPLNSYGMSTNAGWGEVGSTTDFNYVKVNDNTDDVTSKTDPRADASFIMPINALNHISSANGTSGTDCIIAGGSGAVPSDITNAPNIATWSWESMSTTGVRSGITVSVQKGSSLTGTITDNITSTRPFTTHDNDQDSYSANCSNYSGGHGPFWYGSCYNHTPFGSNGAPYWSGWGDGSCNFISLYVK